MSRRAIALLQAAHGGPALAVTAVAAALALSADLGVGRALMVVGAVFTGQLSIGWSNDLADLGRDQRAGRRDKPLVNGTLDVRLVTNACRVALFASVVLSLACGAVAGAVNLLCTAAGWTYNLGLKSTWWSWLPYAVAFGGLPVFVSLAQVDAPFPPWWAPVAGALLGVGAHFVNVVPDLADDEATGVRGLPHRLGARWSLLAATVLLVGASVLLTVLAPAERGPLTWLTLGLVLVLAACVTLGTGRTPFRAAVAIALVDVLALTWVR
ncbi:UbiA family prenyltransferase [Nocardioides sp.]|uniref:UbiA family prenyltransferase n=1 Tax=Nocardioides sp. TaxID=35761 RepID=UPI003D10B83A